MTHPFLRSLALLGWTAVSTLTTSCSSQREAPDDRARADTSRQSSWCGVLSPDAYHVLRGKGTEPRFSGEFWLHDADGVYVCMGCGHALFDSGAKFKSNSGWPSFYAPARDASVATHLDLSHGMRRMEIVCGACNGHLGHVFEDGPPPTGLRYCINSVALDFVPRDSVALRVPSVALPNPRERP